MLRSKVGHYEVLALIGAGGMGEVWRARDTKLHRDVAIKTLPEEFASNSDRIARFEREACFLAALNHPNIAGIYGLEEFEEMRFLVLELVEGETLADRIQRGPIPVEEGLKIALQIAEALEAAHEKHVMHRDLKPANIKVTAEGKVKVLDFGLAKTFLGDAHGNLSNSDNVNIAATRQGIIMGTAGYMPPEQARGQAVDKRADIWAFGCVLFEILSGRGTFNGKSVSDVLASVLKTEPDWNSLPANLHPRILYLLQRCLEKEPEDRSPGMADARVEIKKVLADSGGVLARGAAETRAGLRSRLPWIAAIAAAAVIASILGWAFKPSEPDPIVQIRVFPPEDQVLPHLPGGSALAVSRDGARVAYAADGQLYLLNLNETEPRPIPGTRARSHASQPVFSPDGQSLAYLDIGPNVSSSSLKRIPVSGGTPVTLIEDWPGGMRGLSWTANDTILFAAMEGIVEIRADGGTPAVIAEAADGETLGSPELLPGGELLLFSSKTGRGINSWDSAQIIVQPLESDDRQLVWQGGGDPRYIPTGHIVYAKGNTLFALPFDIDSLEVMGAPASIVEGVRRSSNGFSDTANYDLSETGSLVYIPGAASTSPSYGILALVDRNGGRQTLNVPPRQYRNPHLSPDGSQLVVEVIGESDGRSGIWIYDLAGESEIRLLTHTGSNTHPLWTSDGESVTFASDRDGAWSIYSLRIDLSTPPERLTAAEEGVQQLPQSWSRDSRMLSFSKRKGPGDSSLWTFSMDTRTSELFHDDPGTVDYGSAFSPDGAWLAYTVTEDPAGIRVQPFPPTGVVHQVTEDSEAWPVWSANGNELFFVLSQDARQQRVLVGVDISTEGAFAVRNRRPLAIQDVSVLAAWKTYDIAPDGKHFVMIVPVEASLPAPLARSRINIVLNWFEELKARVPNR